MPESLLPVELWHWLGFGALVVLLLVLDLCVFHARIHTPTFRESLGWTIFWIVLALIFNAVMLWWGWMVFGTSAVGVTFLTGYLVEKSLSMDNIFVFAVIFRYFRVPLKYQYRVLFWGILGAVFLRLAFILAGVGLIERFDWMLWVFGAVLLYSGAKLAMAGDEEVDPERNIVLRAARRVLRISRQDHEHHFFVRENGLLCITPLFLVLLVVESTDVIFAVDSVPAILGITRDSFIVFTSNVFAILGLRALYFLLAGVMDRFQYLHYGLSGVLVFIGGKMIAEYWVPHKHGEHLIPHWASLAVIVALLIVSIVASIIATRREGQTELQEQLDEGSSEDKVLQEEVPNN